MSEKVREGFDIYAIPGMTEAVLELREKYGVDLSEAEQGVQLAVSMHNTLYDYEKPTKKFTRRGTEKEIKRLYTDAAASIPGITVDNQGCPLPRYRYIASDMLGNVLSQEDPFYDYFATITDAPMVPNFNNTKTVIDVLVPLLQNNEYPYSEERFVLPEDPEHMPKTPFKSDLEEANFYLTACLWMRRTDSNKAMRDLSKAFDDTRTMERDPFEPEVVATMTPEEVEKIFGKYPQLRMLKSNAPGLIHNMKFLLARFDGDIRKAFEGTDDFDEIVMRLKNDRHQQDPSKYMPEFGEGMYGFREKMVSMLTYYEIEAKKVAPISYPPPIDQHLAKLTTGTDSVVIHEDFKNENYMTDYLQGIARELYYDISLKYGININDIAKALWLLGSKNCSQSPITFTRVLKRNARKSVFGKYEHNFTRNGFDTVGIYATCLSCPLHGTELCHSTAQGKRNHLKGEMVLLKRSDVPNPADFAVFGGDPEWERLTAATAAAGRNMADKRRKEVRRPLYEQQQAAVPADEKEPQDQDALFEVAIESTESPKTSLSELAKEISAETGLAMEHCVQIAIVAKNAFSILLDAWMERGIIMKDSVEKDTKVALAIAAKRSPSLPRNEDGNIPLDIQVAIERAYYKLLNGTGEVDFEALIKGGSSHAT